MTALHDPLVIETMNRLCYLLPVEQALSPTLKGDVIARHKHRTVSSSSGSLHLHLHITFPAERTDRVMALRYGVLDMGI